MGQVVMMYSGVYKGTVRTYCSEFDDTYEITFSIDDVGNIDLPSYYGMNDGTINETGQISGISITVRSLSLGTVTIPYTASDDGTTFNGTGSSSNGIISTIQATRMTALYNAVDDAATVIEDSGVVATGNVLANDSGGPATLQSTDDYLVYADNEFDLVKGSYGTFAIAGDGSYRYTLDNNNAAVDALEDGESLTDSLTYTGGNAYGTSDAQLRITIKGHTGRTVNGTDGDDVLYSFDKADAFDGKAGLDLASYVGAWSGVHASLAAPGSNTGAAEGDTYARVEGLQGSSYADVLIGDAGNNILDGAGGPDRLEGGRGNDTYVVDRLDDLVLEAKGAGADVVSALVSYKLAAGQEIEVLQLAASTGTQSLNLTGNEFANKLVGNGGANVLNGLSGVDTMIGGAGSDTYYVDNIGDRAVETNGAAGTDLVIASVSFSLGGSELENLTLTGTANIDGTGNSIANVLTGNAGANILNGLGGADRMIGGAGSDTYYVDNGGDKAVEANGAGGTDLVIASVSYSLGGSELENLTLTGTANINGTGNSVANVITGNGGNNVLNGMGGADRMIGGSGSDTYHVDNGSDKAVEANGAAGTDLVIASVSYSLAGSELEKLTLTGAGNLNGTGNSIANSLQGNVGANVLNGMAGGDTLSGLAGKDTFVFSTALGAGNVDRITDFSAADDTIQLSKSIFTALSGGTLAASAFKDLSVAGAKIDADDRIIYNKTTGALSYDADGSGSKAAVQFAIIDTKVALTHADFLVA